MSEQNSAVRSGMYSLLARLYKQEITPPMLAKLQGTVFPKVCAQPQMETGYRQLERWLASSTTSELEQAAADFAKVFLGAGCGDGKAAFPYESVHTSPKGLVRQEAWEEVKGIYASRGICVTAPNSEVMEDHISTELSYMALLCREGAKEEEQRTFFDTHLINWVPTFCGLVQEYAQSDLYRGLASLTAGWLALEGEQFTSTTAEDGKVSVALSTQALDEIFAALESKYRIYAPKRFVGRGAKKGTDLVRYAPIRKVGEMVTDVPSDFSAKEIFYPVNQTTLYFKDNHCEVSELTDQREILIFARPCDIHAIRRLDKIFMENGKQADGYYQRLREKVHFALLECNGGWDTCFCVSMGSNITEDYALALRLEGENARVQVKDSAFLPYFQAASSDDFAPTFVTENKRAATIPVIPDRDTLKRGSQLDFWKQYNDQCIGCGGCNTVCPTCSCFDTIDVIYDETSRDGERRRVWSSCMLKDFTATAGGHRARATPGDNMRFKVLHKVHDYQVRFGGEEHMCVGCGRCDRRCPRDISFYDAIGGFANALKEEVEGHE